MEMSNSKTKLPQAGRARCSQSRTETSVCLMESGGGKSSIRNERKKKTLLVATYNIQTMRLEEHLEALETELENIRWDIIGLCETRMPGETSTVLKSGHQLFQRNSTDHHHLGGVALLVHHRLKRQITSSRAVSDRVIYIELKLNARHSIKIIQVYAPTAAAAEDEVEQFYEDISTAKSLGRAKHTVILGDFNAKIGEKQVGDSDIIGSYGLGTRNDRGQLLLEFMNKEKMFCMNTFFKKSKQRKWTWRSPNGQVKNEIDYILTTAKQHCADVSVLNRFNTGSDHRLVRAKICINTRLERKKMIQKKSSATLLELQHKRDKYHSYIERKLQPVETLEDLDLNILSEKITKSIQTSVKQVCSLQKGRPSKLSATTINLQKTRREMDRDSPEYRVMDKQVKREIRSDLRNHNTHLIQQAIEDNLNMKELRSNMTRGKQTIRKMRNEQGTVVYEEQEIVTIIQNFYRKLYRQEMPDAGYQRDSRTQILNVGSEEIPEIDTSELEEALRSMKNRKAPGEDRITAEMLKEGGATLKKAILILLNKCLEEGRIPEAWRNAEVKILFKKGDCSNIENYRPISLLSSLYKLLSKILTRRLSKKLDFYQPIEQAGFRKGYSTIDHIQTVRTLMEKCREYNVPLHLGFVDYQKAFDSVEEWAVLNELDKARVDSRYSTLIKNCYENATFHVKITEDLSTEKIPINRGVRQGDSISPKLFTLALEGVFKTLDWELKGINIDGRYLSHLRFADDIVLFSSDHEELTNMLKELKEASQAVGLQMNLGKTKIMSPYNTQVILDNINIETVDEYVYLGHKIKLGSENQTMEIARRVRLTWAKYGNLSHILRNPRTPINLKRKVFESCILPVMTYGLETMTFTQKSANRLRVCQRAIERSMLGISLRDRIRNDDIRRRTGVSDVMETVARNKWRWAGHVARDDVKWTKAILQWRPRETKRGVGRPQTRWRDDIQRHAGKNWIQTAQDRLHWRQLEEAYVQEWTKMG